MSDAEALTEVLVQHCYHNMEFAGIPGGRWSAECNCDATLVGDSHGETELALATHQVEAMSEVVARMLAEAWREGFEDGKRQDAEGDDGPRFENPYEVKA